MALNAYLTPNALERLKEHKYVSGAYSPLDNAVNPFWNSVALCIPCSIAPNVLTVLGLACTLLSFGVELYYAQGLSGTAPSWVYALQVVSIFAYQTLDAVDGKHARNTKSSSPLGQILDHGCDAIGLPILMLSVGMSVQVGSGLKMAGVMLAMQVAFFLATWEEYHLRVLRTSVGVVGITEGEFLLMGIHAVSAVWGPSVWNADVGARVLGWAPGVLIASDVLIGAVMVPQMYLSAIFSKSVLLDHTFTKGDGHGTRREAVRQLLPLLGVAVLCLALFPFLETHPLASLMTMALCLSYMATRMMLCTITRSPLPVFTMPVLWPLPLACLAYWPLGAALPVYVCLAFISAAYAHFAYMAVRDITSYLGICAFTIK